MRVQLTVAKSTRTYTIVGGETYDKLSLKLVLTVMLGVGFLAKNKLIQVALPDEVSLSVHLFLLKFSDDVDELAVELDRIADGTYDEANKAVALTCGIKMDVRADYNDRHISVEYDDTGDQNAEPEG